MAKLIRKNLKLFGKDGATDKFGEFGSQANGNPVNTKDIETIQSLDAWNEGWQSAVALGKAPYLQDMNSVMYVDSYQLCYLLQQGIPEWNADTTYYLGSFVNVVGVVYMSLTDNNINNAVTDTSKWKKIGGNIMTDVGDLVYGGTNGNATKLSGVTTAAPFVLSQTGTGSVSTAPVWRQLKAPTIQILNVGSGTYITPAGCLYIEGELVAGGGGGGGSGESGGGGDGSDGESSSFGGIVSADGGKKGRGDGNLNGEWEYQSFTITSPAVGYGIKGGLGSSTYSISSVGENSQYNSGGNGGGTALAPAMGAVLNKAGTNAPNQTGVGGSGSGGNLPATSNARSGAGGCGGSYVKFYISNPSASYSYSVGAGGGGGNAGTSGYVGGNGGNGLIVIKEYYN